MNSLFFKQCGNSLCECAEWKIDDHTAAQLKSLANVSPTWSLSHLGSYQTLLDHKLDFKCGRPAVAPDALCPSVKASVADGTLSCSRCPAFNHTSKTEAKRHIQLVHRRPRRVIVESELIDLVNFRCRYIFDSDGGVQCDFMARTVYLLKQHARKTGHKQPRRRNKTKIQKATSKQPKKSKLKRKGPLRPILASSFLTASTSSVSESKLGSKVAPALSTLSVSESNLGSKVAPAVKSKVRPKRKSKVVSAVTDSDSSASNSWSDDSSSSSSAGDTECSGEVTDAMVRRVFQRRPTTGGAGRPRRHTRPPPSFATEQAQRKVLATTVRRGHRLDSGISLSLAFFMYLFIYLSLSLFLSISPPLSISLSFFFVFCC
jgi:hypothetical protein